MTLALQYIALVACAVSTIVRTPAALRGRGLPLWTCFALMTVSVALSIPDIYGPVDAVLGGINIANVILRTALYVVFCALGIAISKTFDSMHVEWLISGRPGLWVLGLAMGLTFCAFALGGGAGGDLDTSTPAGLIYGMTWRFYLAYVAVCLLVMLLPVAFDARRRDVYRWSASLLSIGFALVCIMPFAMMAALVGGGEETLVKIISYSSILFVAAGLGMVWIAGRRARREIAQATEAR